MKRPFVLLLTGEPNCGKSTIAYELLQRGLRNCLVIDGDKHREMQFLGKKLGFTKEDILENNEHVIKLAKFAQEQGFNVIIPQIAPYLEQRQQIHYHLDNVLEIYLKCPKHVRSQRVNFKDSDLVYEEGGAQMTILTEVFPIHACAQMILGVMG